MFSALYDTTITRLKIRAPAHLQDSVRRELQQAHWPVAGSEHIVFVRKLSAKAPCRDIGRLLLDQARHQIHYSNDSENVIRFANRLEMLAALLADLANGRAAGRWYWQRWIHLFAFSTSRALYSVLADNLTQLNALAEVLALHQQLVLVWRNLAEEEAQQLIHELSWKNGYSFSAQAIKPTTDPVPVHVPQRILQRWQGVLTFPPTSSRFRLATLLIAQECAPLALMKRTDLTLSAIAASLEKPVLNDQHPAKPQGQDESISAESHSEIFEGEAEPKVLFSDKSIYQGKAQSPDSQLPHHTPLANTSEVHRSSFEENNGQKTREYHDEILLSPADNEEKQQPKYPINKNREPLQSASHPLHKVKVRKKPETAISRQFITEQGGVLYLLNFLNRPPLQKIMGDYWQQLPNGWIWLYRLAELLDFNEQDQMALFLADQLGLDNRDDLAKLPSLPKREQIEILAEQWYGKAGVWRPSLMLLPATISYNASHIDMHTAMSSVRLDLRLAGLDINPGWLPWLGRVVQFHFDQNGGLHHE